MSLSHYQHSQRRLIEASLRRSDPKLASMLGTLGIHARASRRATLTDFAAQLPAAVLADLLHLSPGTAVHWMRQAGADWTGYAAQIARTHNHQP